MLVTMTKEDLMTNYAAQIRSKMNPLINWEDYRNLLIQVLHSGGFFNFEDSVRSNFTADHFNNPQLLVDDLLVWCIELETQTVFLQSQTKVTTPELLLNLLLALNNQSTIIQNGNFATGDLTGWITGYATSVTDGIAFMNRNNVSLANMPRQDNVLVIGVEYSYSIRVHSVDFQVRLGFGGTTGSGRNDFLEPGVFTGTSIATDTSLYCGPAGNKYATCTVSDIQIWKTP